MSVLERPHTNGVLDGISQPEATHASMLQELLLALVGHDGDVFVRDSAHQLEGAEYIVAEPGSCDTRLAADVNWISLADRRVAAVLAATNNQHEPSPD